MREDLTKVLFIGDARDRNAFFLRAQSAGVVHFIDQNISERRPEQERIQAIVKAIKVLRGYPEVPQEENEPEMGSERLVEQILALHQQKQTEEENARVLALEIERISPFGDFSFEQIRDLERNGNCVVQFFCARADRHTAEALPEGLVEIAQEHGLTYYLSVRKERLTEHHKMIEMTFDRTQKQLEDAIAFSERHIHEIHALLKQCARYKDHLHRVLARALDDHALDQAKECAEDTLEDHLFAVTGWVPQNRLSRVRSIIAPLHVEAEVVMIEPQDQVPTCLQNEGMARLGEDLVGIYDTPSCGDHDPSLWVLGFFTLFFAMIIGDAGYGAIYLALACLLRYRFHNSKGLAKRMLDLFAVLSVGCVAWGILANSYFGMQLTPGNPLRKLSLVQWLAEKKGDYHFEHKDATYRDFIQKFPNAKNAQTAEEFVRFHDPDKGLVILNKLNDHVMFELALLIGVLHLFLSLVRYSRRNWHQIGWALFLVGAYLYFPHFLNTPSVWNYTLNVDLAEGGKVGLELMGIGFFGAWLLAIFKHGWTGIFEVMTVIQLFADTLSYLRLYALALAGAIVSATVNEIAVQLPLVLAVTLTLLSHVINMVLSTMSGVIHGLRLNFLEWYHYSFEGGGKKFNPLRHMYQESDKRNV